MNLRTETLPLEGFGVKSTKAQVEIQVLTLGERLKRGALGPALGFGMALVTLGRGADVLLEVLPGSREWNRTTVRFDCHD